MGFTDSDSNSRVLYTSIRDEFGKCECSTNDDVWLLFLEWTRTQARLIRTHNLFGTPLVLCKT